MEIYYVTKDGELKTAKIIKSDNKMILQRNGKEIEIRKDDPILLIRCWYTSSLPNAVAISRYKDILMEMLIHRILFRRGNVKLNKDTLDELKSFIRKKITGVV